MNIIVVGYIMYQSNNWDISPWNVNVDHHINMNVDLNIINHNHHNLYKRIINS